MTPRPPLLTDPPNRILTALLAYAVLSGVLYLTGVTEVRSIQVALPPALRVLWAVCLVTGGAAALTGQYWRGRRVFTGAKLKRGGLLVAGGGILAYGSALLLVNGLAVGGQAGLTSLVFGAAFFDRAHQISGLLREAAPHAEAIHQATDLGGDGELGASG